MKKLSLFLFLFSGIIVQAQSILSPSKNISLEFKLSNEGKPTYKVVYKTKEVIKESTLGLTLKDNQDFILENIKKDKLEIEYNVISNQVGELRTQVCII